MTLKEIKIWKMICKRIEAGEDLYDVTQEYVDELREKGDIY